MKNKIAAHYYAKGWACPFPTFDGKKGWRWD